MSSVLEAPVAIKILLERQVNEEVLALYVGGRYVLSQDYQNYYATIWHSLSQERRERHIQYIRTVALTVKQTFGKPVNAGRKPGCQQRI